MVKNEHHSQTIHLIGFSVRNVHGSSLALFLIEPSQGSWDMGFAVVGPGREWAWSVQKLL